MLIRNFEPGDPDATLAIILPVLRAGITCALDADLSEANVLGDVGAFVMHRLP